ncbi:MAG: hypothetical protein ACRDUW_00005 [Pseudonocardiaceae bacterium]
MVTTARHRRRSPAWWITVVVAAALGAAIGGGGVLLATSAASPPAAPVTARKVAPPIAPAVHPADTTSNVEPVAFAQPTPGPLGMTMELLTPERIPGGLRLTIAVSNPTTAPIMLDTGMMGPPELRFNGAPVYLYTVPMRKTLAPGEGYSWQCTLKLPTSDAGQLTFSLGSVTVAGRVAQG